MFVWYSYQDKATAEPLTGAKAWLHEQLVNLVYARPAMDTSVKKAVIAFKDNADGNVYKHHVPWERIVRQLESNIGDMSRVKTVTYLQKILKELGLECAGATDTQIGRYYFDGWVALAMGTIADYPSNIFKGESSGDGAGTRLDIPDDPSTELIERLQAARAALKSAVGVSLDKTHTISEVYAKKTSTTDVDMISS